MRSPIRAVLAACAAAACITAAPAFAADLDGDGVADAIDNCSEISNADQRDTNGDGYGNACDADLDNNLAINFVNLGIMKEVFFMSDADADLNGDGSVNFVNLATMKSTFFGAPGPGPVTPTYNNDVQPILEEKCDTCHTEDGFGGHNIASNYDDTFLDSNYCPGRNVGECSLVRIQDGTMPQVFPACTGDPAKDAGNPNCLTQVEQDTIEAWIDAGFPE